MSESVSWIDAWWRGRAGIAGRTASVLLWPAEHAFTAATSLRRGLYGAGLLPSRHPGPAVVSVGNLTVGGTGKTPVAAMIARRIADRGTKVAVALRGYGSDELALHRRWNPDISVYSARRRVEAVRTAANDGAQVVVLDDGFQHLALERELDVVLVSAEQWTRYPARRRLPRGPYRERVSQLRRADVIVVTERAAGVAAASATLDEIRVVAPRTPVALARLVADRWMTLDGAEADAPRGDVLAVAGIADPASFRAVLGQRLKRDVPLTSFPDHYAFSEQDILELEGQAGARALVTTEKDAVRIVGADPERWRVLGLAVALDDPEGVLDQALDHLAERP